MKLRYVQFVNVVSFGGQLQSASNKPVGDRPGQGGVEIELSEHGVKLTKQMNGVAITRHVPLSNVASMEFVDEPAPKANPLTPKK